MILWFKLFVYSLRNNYYYFTNNTNHFNEYGKKVYGIIKHSFYFIKKIIEIKKKQLHYAKFRLNILMY